MNAAASLALDEIRAIVEPHGRIASIGIFCAFCDHTDPEDCVFPTDDGGLTITFRCGKREVMFAMPAKGRPVYFSARGDGERHAGIVRNYLTGSYALHDWMLGAAFVPTDLDVGSVS